MPKIWSIALIFICSFSTLHGQSKRKLLEQGKAYMAVEHYTDAINTLKQSKTLLRKDEEGRFLLGICYYQLNDLKTAEAFFNTLIEGGRAPYQECWWYLGQIRHAQQQFDKAIELYKLYLRTLRPDHPNRAMVVEEIRRCDNGLRWQYRDPVAVVENLGDEVNTAADEFGPVLSPNRSTQLYFSSVRAGNNGGARNADNEQDEQYGSFRSDMYSTRMAGGQWQRPTSLHYLLNTPQHERVVGFSNQRQVLLYYRSWDWRRGEIFADTFQEASQRSLRTTPFLSPLSGEQGEHQFYLYNDTLLIFASRRAGGYGGLDLYRTSFKNGRWQAPQNLGPTINSVYDETTPFLARDGQTLYYSTNDSRRSVGGLDIVRTVYIPEAQRWSEAENLGFPINSAADDSHFILARDGFTAYFNSARKDGKGQRDLYASFFSKYRKEMDLPAVSQTEITVPPRPIEIEGAITPTRSPALRWLTSGGDFNQLISASSTNEWLSELVNQRQGEQNVVVSIYVPQQSSGLGMLLFRTLQQLDQQLTPRLERLGLARSVVFYRAIPYTGTNYHLNASLQLEPNDRRVNLPVIGVNNSTYGAALPANASLTYRVQVQSVQRGVNDESLARIEDLMVEKSADFAYYRYTAGSSTTFDGAKQRRQQLLQAGFRGAYIVPYIYGSRINQEQARRYARLFPDLARYLGR